VNLSHAEFKDVDLSSTTIIDSIYDHTKNLDLSESNEPEAYSNVELSDDDLSDLNDVKKGLEL